MEQKKENTNEMENVINGIAENNETESLGNDGQKRQFEYGSYAWALDVLIKAVNVGQAHGSYTISESAMIHDAIYVINNSNVTVTV